MKVSILSGRYWTDKQCLLKIHKMGMVSLNSHWILRKVITDCTRKIELIGSYPRDCGQDR